jgi:hypothetical protein
VTDPLPLGGRQTLAPGTVTTHWLLAGSTASAPVPVPRRTPPLPPDDTLFSTVTAWLRPLVTFPTARSADELVDCRPEVESCDSTQVASSFAMPSFSVVTSDAGA